VRRRVILLVDDDQEIIDVLERVAVTVFPEARFIQVTSFTKAVAYLEGLDGIGPELILLDLDLNSEMTGLDFLRYIRQHPQGGMIPTVILSGDGREATVSEAYSCGANAFTMKPFDYKGFMVYIEQIRDFWFKTATMPKLYVNSSGRQA